MYINMVSQVFLIMGETMAREFIEIAAQLEAEIANNDKKPVASFKLVKPAKMNELRLYRADYMTFYNHRTVMKNMKLPAGIVEGQSADGSWKQIGRFSESDALCLKIKLDGKIYQAVKISFSRPGFALSEVELF